MKAIVFKSYWGEIEFQPSDNREHPDKIFNIIRGPRGATMGVSFLNATDALALSEYLKTWALEVLKDFPAPPGGA